VAASKVFAQNFRDFVALNFTFGYPSEPLKFWGGFEYIIDFVLLNPNLKNNPIGIRQCLKDLFDGLRNW